MPPCSTCLAILDTETYKPENNEINKLYCNKLQPLHVTYID